MIDTLDAVIGIAGNLIGGVSLLIRPQPSDFPQIEEKITDLEDMLKKLESSKKAVYNFNLFLSTGISNSIQTENFLSKFEELKYLFKRNYSLPNEAEETLSKVEGNLKENKLYEAMVNLECTQLLLEKEFFSELEDVEFQLKKYTHGLGRIVGSALKKKLHQINRRKIRAEEIQYSLQEYFKDIKEAANYAAEIDTQKASNLLAIKLSGLAIFNIIYARWLYFKYG